MVAACMTTVRIAVASTPLTATLAEAVPAAIAAIEHAGRLGASVVCLPETSLPGHRGQTRSVPDVSEEALAAALREVGQAARRAGVVSIVGAERPTPRGREIVSVVFDANGTVLGEQQKTQIDPSEERDYVHNASSAQASLTIRSTAANSISPIDHAAHQISRPSSHACSP